MRAVGRSYRRPVTPMSDAETRKVSLREMGATPNWKRLLVGGSTFGIYLRRMRRLTLGEALRASIPTKYDTLLYPGDRQSLAAVPAVTSSLPLVVGHYDKDHKSGIPDVDRHLRGRVEGCAALVDGVNVLGLVFGRRITPMSDEVAREVARQPGPNDGL